MAWARHFLDWHVPPLAAAADWLVQDAAQHATGQHATGQHATGSLLDMSGTIVVVPGGRAGRRLRELLLERIERRKGAFFPPQITTLGRLPEMLYELKRPLADTLTQQLAWATALQRTARGDLQHLTHYLPDSSQVGAWLPLAELLARQHRELAADGLDFRHVLAAGEGLEDFQEHARWEILAQIQSRYLQLLDELGLWDRQTARRVAIERGECRSAKRLILAGTVDMNRATRRMLDQVQDRVTVLVFAPQSYAHHFDQQGCLIPEVWQDACLQVPDEVIVCVPHAEQQGVAAACALQEVAEEFSASEVSLGVPDESVLPSLQGALERAGLRSRFGPGRPAAGSSLFQCLAAIANYQSDRRGDHFATLARHPDVFRWLVDRRGVAPTWLTELDALLSTQLPAQLDGPYLEHWPRAYGHLRRAVQAMEAWLSGLGTERHSLEDWSVQLADVVAELYEGVSVNKHSELARTLGCLQDAFAQFSAVPPALQLEISSAEAIALALKLVGDVGIPADPDPEAIELLGWLELAWDDAPALLVTNMNEGVVPEASSADLFLPDRLRQTLGLEDNRRRYARDAYSLSVLLHTRRYLRLIVPKLNSDGDPLLPSRLLLAETIETLPLRCARLFGDTNDLPAVAETLSAEPAGSGAEPIGEFRIPHPDRVLPSVSRRPAKSPEPIPIHLRVTDLAAYLRSPYEYFLTRVLQLEEVSDLQQELDPLSFGILAHDVLQRFGMGSYRHSQDADEIRAELDSLLDGVVAERFSASPLPAVMVQTEQLRRRLHNFADRQACHRAEGWEIRAVEVSAPDRPCWITSDFEIQLRGRIDRIDYHPERQQWMVLDYKTGEQVTGPDQQHRKGRGQDRQWIDFQLPLYRHICTNITLDCGSRIPRVDCLGFVPLARRAASQLALLAEWSDDELEAADAAALDIVRLIGQHQFWPPVDGTMEDWSSLAAIQQHGVLDRDPASH